MMTQPQVDLTKTTVVEFSIKDEPWAKFRLEDGTLLLGRLIIFKFYRGQEYDTSGQPIYIWSSQNLFSTVCPKTLKGTPTVPPPASLDPATVNTTPVDFERLGPEKWNVYELSDGSVVRAKLEISSILRTDKFGADGDPLYVINSPMIPRVKIPPALIKKQQLLKPDREQPKGVYG